MRRKDSCRKNDGEIKDTEEAGAKDLNERMDSMDNGEEQMEMKLDEDCRLAAVEEKGENKQENEGDKNQDLVKSPISRRDSTWSMGSLQEEEGEKGTAENEVSSDTEKLDNLDNADGKSVQVLDSESVSTDSETDSSSSSDESGGDLTKPQLDKRTSKIALIRRNVATKYSLLPSRRKFFGLQRSPTIVHDEGGLRRKETGAAANRGGFRCEWEGCGRVHSELTKLVSHVNESKSTFHALLLCYAHLSRLYDPHRCSNRSFRTYWPKRALRVLLARLSHSRQSSRSTQDPSPPAYSHWRRTLPLHGLYLSPLLQTT